MPLFRDRDAHEPAHAEGKRHVELPSSARTPTSKAAGKRQHDQPWVPKSGLVGRTRRSARRS
jgi:hypothetical protein